MSNSDEEPILTGKSGLSIDEIKKRERMNGRKLKRLGNKGKNNLTSKKKEMESDEIKALWEVILDSRNKSHTFKPLINNDYILINADGHTKKFDSDGKRIFNIRTGALNHIRPAIDRDENIYIVNRNEVVSLTGSGRLRWQTLVGEVSHTPFIDEDGMVYLANRNSHAIALNPDGSVYWKKKIDELESSMPFVDNRGNLHLKLFEGSHIILNRKRGFFNPSVIRKVNGKSTKPVDCGPDGRLYFATCDHVENVYSCMDINGKILWKVRLPSDTKTVFNSLITDSLILVTVRTDSIIDAMSGADDDERDEIRKKGCFLLGLKPDGTEIFRFHADGEEKFARHIVMSDDENLYFTNKYKPGKLYALNKEGKLLWKQVTDTSLSRPRIGPYGKLILTGGKNTSLKVFSISDGKLLGEKQTNLAHGQSYQVLSDGDVIAVDRDGKMEKLSFSEIYLKAV